MIIVTAVIKIIMTVIITRTMITMCVVENKWG